MRLKLHIILIFYISLWSLQRVRGQNPEMAKHYFEQGDLDKAAYEYQLLVDKFPYNKSYLFNLIKIYQSQSKFKTAENLLRKQNLKQNPQFLVYLGYNYQLQKDSIKSEKYYQKALKIVKKQAYKAYAVGESFTQLYLLNYALKTYQTALKNSNNTNLYLKIALIYAEQNRQDLMMQNFLKLIDKDDRYTNQIKYYLSKYITQDPENKANIILKKQLIEKIKTTGDTKWYRLLQWLYIQQKDYKKAFLQLKSLYRKNEADLSEIYHLAHTALVNKKDRTAKSIYQFIINQNNSGIYGELSKLALLDLDMQQILDNQSKQQIAEQFNRYLHEKWSTRNHLQLQIAYAGFLAFHQNKTTEALNVLDSLQQQTLPKKQMANILIKKADILLHNQKFNQALVLYTQVQLDFPNNPTGHKATYDLARASFFQGDIDWAHAQLKVIKSVADDLIANDAIDLDLLIINNKEEGDTIQAGLKTLAKAKFEIYRKNRPGAIKILDSLKQNYKGQLVYDDGLMLQAQLYEQIHQYDDALKNYQAILDSQTEDLLKDDAIFRMGIIYETLGQTEKAKALFKKIILEYPASFWFVDARKHYRRLRGDLL